MADAQGGLLDDARRLARAALADVAQCADLETLAALRARLVGKQGSLKGLLKGISTVPAAERPAAGAEVNRLVRDVESALEAHKAQNYASSREEMLRLVTEQVERSWEAAPRFFGRLPKANCEVKPVEEFREDDMPGAYYHPGTPDGDEWFSVGHTSLTAPDPLSIGLHAIGRIDRTIYEGAYPEGVAIRFERFELWR